MAQLEQLLVTDSTQKHGSVRATIDWWLILLRNMAQLEQLLVTDSTQKHGSVRATIGD